MKMGSRLIKVHLNSTYGDQNVSQANDHCDDSLTSLRDDNICFRVRSGQSSAVRRPVCALMITLCVTLVIKWLKSQFVLRFHREHRHYIQQPTSIFLWMCSCLDVCGGGSIVTAWCSLQCVHVYILDPLCVMSAEYVRAHSPQYWREKALCFHSLLCRQINMVHNNVNYSISIPVSYE